METSLEHRHPVFILSEQITNECNIKDCSIPTLTSLLKLYLSEIPLGGVCGSFNQKMVDLASTNEVLEVEKVKKLIETFPRENRFLLNYLIHHFATVARNKDIHNMNAEAISICLAPSLFPPELLQPVASTTNTNITSSLVSQNTMMENLQNSITITAFLINNCEGIFGCYVAGSY
eukprot:Pgem_evm1s12828